MRKLSFLIAAAILLSVGAAAENKGPRFSGTWTLDAKRSKIAPAAPLDSQVLTVAQTDKDIKVETSTKRPPAAASDGEGAGRLADGGVTPDGTFVYTLDGNEVTTNQEIPEGKVTVKLSAKSTSDKLYLFTTRTVPTRELAPTPISIRETWALSADGQTLTINRKQSSRFDEYESTLVYSKK